MSIGSAAGFCEKHNMDKMFVGLEDATEATCVKCVADATPKLGRTQIVEDPGEEYFQGKGTNAKIMNVPANSIPQKSTIMVVGQQASFSEGVENALKILGSLPMPKDLKQFKAVQKAVKILEALKENPDGR